MALNVSRWIAYAKARLDDTISDGHRELDRLEAEREVELADKPWLRTSGTTPTLDEVRARIEWEAERAKGTGPAEPPEREDPPARDDATGADDSARLELEARRREAAARLDAIRAELGASPEGPPPS